MLQGKRCAICDGVHIKYGSTGFKAILGNVITEMENSRLPGADEPREDVFYGATMAYFDAPPTTAVPPKTSAHIMDQVSNAEA